MSSTNSRKVPNPIVRLSSGDLTCGNLNRLFRNQVKAVILDDPRVGQLWRGFLGVNKGNFVGACVERMPWEDNFFDMARNHEYQNYSSGDMLRFTPRGIAHVARKIKIWPAQGTKMQTIPEYFWNGNKRVVFSHKLLRTAWALMSDILKSMLPANFDPAPHAVEIDFLKYPNSSDELANILALLGDASGCWTQIGQRIDANKGMARGIFNRKVLRDLFGLASLIPGISPGLQCLDDFLGNVGHDNVTDNLLIIGEEHVDGSKLLTGLASERDVLKTEVYDGNCWHELHLTTDTLAIFPSAKLDKAFGIPPTKHRVLLKEQDRYETPRKRNITLSLSIVDNPSDVWSFGVYQFV